MTEENLHSITDVKEILSLFISRDTLFGEGVANFSPEAVDILLQIQQLKHRRIVNIVPTSDRDMLMTPGQFSFTCSKRKAAVKGTGA